MKINRCSENHKPKPNASDLNMPIFTRREILIGTAAGATGGVAGIAAYRNFRGHLSRLLRGSTSANWDIIRSFPPGATPSFSQSGEDVVIRELLRGIDKPSYLD